MSSVTVLSDLRVIAADPPLTAEEERALDSAWRLGGEVAIFPILDAWLLEGRGWNRVTTGSFGTTDALEGRGIFGRILVQLRGARIPECVLSCDGKFTLNRVTKERKPFRWGEDWRKR